MRSPGNRIVYRVLDKSGIWSQLNVPSPPVNMKSQHLVSYTFFGAKCMWCCKMMVLIIKIQNVSHFVAVKICSGF